MDEKLIREAVAKVEKFLKQACDTNRDGRYVMLMDNAENVAIDTLEDLANSYLSVIEEGVPEEKPATVMITHTTGEAGVIIEHPTADIYAEGWNALRKIMLLLLAKLKMEKKSLTDRYTDLQYQLDSAVEDNRNWVKTRLEDIDNIAKLQKENEELKATMSLDLIRKLQSTLAEKDREILDRKDCEEKTTLWNEKLAKECAEKDQRIAELEERLIKTTEAGLKVCEEASKSHPAVEKEEIATVIKNFGSPMNGVTWDYWIENIAQAILDMMEKH